MQWRTESLWGRSSGSRARGMPPHRAQPQQVALCRHEGLWSYNKRLALAKVAYFRKQIARETKACLTLASLQRRTGVITIVKVVKHHSRTQRETESSGMTRQLQHAKLCCFLQMKEFIPRAPVSEMIEHFWQGSLHAGTWCRPICKLRQSWNLKTQPVPSEWSTLHR